MSDRIQFEHHPDADQISAFVEHALPAHEREQMLGHLAVCPECRAVVALSLPSVEAPAQRLPGREHKPWWSGWMVAWPASAALAAIVLLVVFFPHGKVAPIAPAPNQMARANPPAPMPQKALPTSSAAPALRSIQQQPAGSSRGPIAGSAPAAAKQSYAIASAAQNIGGLRMEDRNVADPVVMAQAAPRPSPGRSEQGVATGAAPSQSAGNAIGGPFAQTQTQVAQARLQQAAPASPAAPRIVTAQSATSAPVLTLPVQSTETVVVENSGSMPTVSAGAANISLAENELQSTLPKHALPSRLPVLSMATQGIRIVAIDARNAVFLSRDGGRHWKAIVATWPGRAVKADLVAYPAGGLIALGRDKTAGMARLTADSNAPAGKTSDALAVQGGALKEFPGSGLTGRVTDSTGAVIAGASVSVTDTAAHTVRTVRTDGAGRYVVDGLAPGVYRVEAQAQGFERKVLAAVAVTDSRPTEQDLILNVGAATQTVTVEASSMEIAVSDAKKARPAPANQTVPVFQIITDNGERWTSTDGVTWKPM